MKKIFTSLLIISAFLMVCNITTSCSKVEDIIDEISVPIPFSVPASVDEVTLPIAIANTTDTYEYPEIPLNLNLDQKIKDKYPSLSVNNLKSVKLDGFNIQFISSNLEFNLDVIKNAKIYIKAPNLDRKPIATITNNTNGTVLNFVPETNDAELIEYLKSPQNSFILEVQGAKVATDLLKVKVNASFRLEVGL